MNARLDANEVALNRYLGEIDADDRRNALIDSRANELLAAHYSPSLPSNIMEALAEMNETHCEALAAFMKSGNKAGLGEYVFEEFTRYCASMALDVAEYDINRAATTECPRCLGRGCGKCLED